MGADSAWGWSAAPLQTEGARIRKDRPSGRAFMVDGARPGVLRSQDRLDLDQCSPPAGRRSGSECSFVWGAGVSILLRVVAAGLVLLVALALNEELASACGRRPALLPAQSSQRIAAVRQTDHALVAAEAIFVCGVENCATGGPSGDECGSDHCCCGHCPTCSGGVIAPASTDLLAPRLSSERLMPFATAMTGVSQSPDERPPRRM